ncbi:hypothetical protein GCM10009550_15160 [Actinocorallia libanotica]|uniref:Uncharacterized protein n=1 Tax=Actinocorallia libanotica TaxID=46162 RepID=A0ABN1QIR6_9ACTN
MEADCSGSGSANAVRDQGGVQLEKAQRPSWNCRKEDGGDIGSALKPAVATGRYERCR